MTIKVDENGLSIINGKFGALKEEMQSYYAKKDCGCCTAELHFKNEASIAKAFQKAGMDSSAVITDDVDAVHVGIDTFYGYSRDSEEQEERSLGYLASLLQ